MTVTNRIGIAGRTELRDARGRLIELRDNTGRLIYADRPNWRRARDERDDTIVITPDCPLSVDLPAGNPTTGMTGAGKRPAANVPMGNNEETT